MTSITLAPHPIDIRAKVPFSKSVLIRLATLALAADIPFSFPDEYSGEDSKAMRRFFEHIQSKSKLFDAGESALIARIAPSLIALKRGTGVIRLTGSLRNRPMSVIGQTLNGLGVSVVLSEHKDELIVSGRLRGGTVVADCSTTTQVATGLLLTLPFVGTSSEIVIQPPDTFSYLSLTLKLLQSSGISLFRQNGVIYIPETIPSVTALPAVERDWSAAAALLVAGAVAGQVTLLENACDSAQPDRVILSLLEDVGATVEIDNDTVSVERNRVRAFDFDASEAPDLVPVLAALAAEAEGTSTIFGIQKLRFKESDRLKAIATEFTKAGIPVVYNNTCVTVTGKRAQSSELNAHGDHRIAMACAILALNAEGPITISGAEAVNKSFPGFFNFFK